MLTFSTLLAEIASLPDPLAGELKRYHAELPDLLAHDEGKFVLIADDALIGVYETYADAMSVGYQKKNLKPFLVMQIKKFEPAYYLSRPVFPRALAHGSV